MFNVGDRVKCNSGGSRGKVGTVVGQSTPYAGKQRIKVKFDDYPWYSDLWEHRFTLLAPVDKAQAIINKIKIMEARQSWKSLQS